MKRNNRKIFSKNTKGITLIALVVTIIVLLILAGVAIMLTVGENGLFNRAKIAIEESKKAELKEELETVIAELEIERLSNGQELTKADIAEKLGEISVVVYDDENTIEGEYKNYEYVVDEENKVTIGSKLEGEVPVVDIRILDTEENMDKVRIEVNATGMEIESIEMIKGVSVNETEESKGKKIFEVTENGTYTFKVIGINKRRVIKSETVTNIVDKSKLKEELEKLIKEVKDEKGEDATKADIAEKLKEVATVIYDTDEKIEGEYKGYGFIVDEDDNVTIGERITGKTPVLTVTLLDTEEDQDQVRIQVTATVEDGEIRLIESLNGYTPTAENGNADKTFTVNKNGEFKFKAVGESGRVGAEKITVQNILPTYESLYEGIDKTKVSGETRFKVNGEKYFLNVITYKGDMELDGAKTYSGATLNSTNKIYEFGNASVDVGTASTNAKNTVVVKIEGNLKINENVTMTSVKNSAGYGGPKGMVIYCTGTITNNGTISMTARGGKAAGQNVYLWKNKSNNTYETVPAAGGAGGASEYADSGSHWQYRNGINGTAGTSRALGGGASGGAGIGSGGVAHSGAGGTATSYSGGAGGGGAYNYFSGNNYWSEAGSSAGGKGGSAIPHSGDGEGGGAGNCRRCWMFTEEEMELMVQEDY